MIGYWESIAVCAAYLRDAEMAQKTNDEKGYLISAKGYYDLTLDLAREYRISQEKVIHDTEEYNQMELDQWDTYSMMN